MKWHLKRQYLQIVQKSALVVVKHWLIVSETIFLNNHSTQFYPTKKEISSLALYILMLAKTVISLDNHWFSILSWILSHMRNYGDLIVIVWEVYVYMVTALNTVYEN
jgi:hypothetical protein